jgi:hypothetical protein
MSRLVTGVAEAQQRRQQHGRGAACASCAAQDTSAPPASWLLAREFAASGLSVGAANTLLNPVGESGVAATSSRDPATADVAAA